MEDNPEKKMDLNNLTEIGAIENMGFIPDSDNEWAKYHYNDAKMYLKLNRIEDAESKFLESLNQDKSFFESANELINLYKIRGRLDDGIKLINEVIAHYKNNDKNLLLYYKADLKRLKGDFEESILSTNSIISEFPDDYKTYLLRGDVYLMNQQKKSAKNDYRIVAEKSPKTIKSRPDSLLNFVILFEEELSYSKKISLLKESINLMPNWEFSYYNLSVLMMRNKDYEGAVNHLLNAHKINDKEVSYVELIVDCLYNLRKRDLMKKFLIKGIHLGSENCKINLEKLEKGII